MSEIFLGIVAVSLMFTLWVMLFFIFDAEVLNGYFKRKLQKRFPVEEVK